MVLTLSAAVGFAVTLHTGAGGLMLALALLGLLGCTVTPAMVSAGRRDVWICPACRTTEEVPKRTAPRG